jgi:hypothetical protein
MLSLSSGDAFPGKYGTNSFYERANSADSFKIACTWLPCAVAGYELRRVPGESCRPNMVRRPYLVNEDFPDAPAPFGPSLPGWTAVGFQKSLRLDIAW